MPEDILPIATILDAARLHFRHVARSPGYTREAREQALKLERNVEAELAAWNSLSDDALVEALAA